MPPYIKEKYNRQYDDKNTQRLYIKLNKNTDKDILQKLSNVPNKQGYIKQLIRSDLKEKTDC